MRTIDTMNMQNDEVLTQNYYYLWNSASHAERRPSGGRADATMLPTVIFKIAKRIHGISIYFYEQQTSAKMTKKILFFSFLLAADSVATQRLAIE